MVLPADLIAAIKTRATVRGQTITAYICSLVQLDLAVGDVPAGAVGVDETLQRLEALEQRVAKLERQGL